MLSQQLKRDMDALDTWLNFREHTLHESDVGHSIDVIEEQLRKHTDFEQMVLAQEGKFNDINRLTLVSKDAAASTGGGGRDERERSACRLNTLLYM